MKYALVLLFFVPHIASAVFLSTIDLSLVPENPRPNERVTVQAHLRGGDAQITEFYWYIEGVLVSQGVGVTSVVLDAPRAGENKKVQVVTGTGASAEAAQIFIRPAEVLLLWEARTTVPPLYIGLPRAISGSSVTVTAVPIVSENGSPVATQDLFYSWSMDGVQQKQRGFGVKTVSLTPPFYDDAFTVSVVVSTRNGSVTAEQRVRISPTKPQIVVYEETPLGGIHFARAVQSSFAFETSEVSFVAFPLYTNSTFGLTPQWTLNGTQFELEGDPWRAVFRKTTAGTGSFTVGLSYEHERDFLERASRSFLVQF